MDALVICIGGDIGVIILQVHQACQRKMLLVRGSQPQGQGHWPIPEAYWPDPNHQGVPPRHPHPMIAYKPVDADPYIPPNFIFDKYEVLPLFFFRSSLGRGNEIAQQPLCLG